MPKDKGCDACGTGLTPDERMNFEGQSYDDILEATHRMIDLARLQLSSAECCLSKLLELRKAEVSKG